MPNCRIPGGTVFFGDTLRQAATLVIETTQLVLSQFKNILTESIVNWIR